MSALAAALLLNACIYGTSGASGASYQSIDFACLGMPSVLRPLGSDTKHTEMLPSHREASIEDP